MNKQTKDTIETGKQATDQVQSMLSDANDRAKGQMEKSARIVEEMAELTRGNIEALVASSKAAAKSVETLGQEATDYSRRSFEEATSAFKSFAEVKSPADLIRLQTEYARNAFDSMVAETSRMSEMAIKLAGDVAEPLTSRYAVAADRVKNIAA